MSRSFLSIALAILLQVTWVSAARGSLRFHLQNLANELELLIRNQKVDLEDVHHQQRDFEALRVFDRIPRTEDLAHLESELKRSAPAQVRIEKIRVLRRASDQERAPYQIFSDQDFEPQPNLIAQTIVLNLRISGDRLKIQTWIDSWHDHVLRWIEPKSRLSRVSENSWNLTAQIFRFRTFRYPRVVPRDPLELLPKKIRQDPKDLEKFMRTHPEISKLIVRIRALRPRALPFYETRREFLENDARLSFYLRLVR